MAKKLNIKRMKQRLSGKLKANDSPVDDEDEDEGILNDKYFESQTNPGQFGYRRIAAEGNKTNVANLNLKKAKKRLFK